MINRIITALVFMATLYSCNKPSTLESVKKEIETQLAGQEGIFAVAFKDLQTGEEILIREHEIFHAASTMKTPVMVELYKQEAEGKFSLTDSVVIINEFKSIVDSSAYSLSATDDSDTLIYKHIGEKRTLYALMYDMIIWSSNLATNIVIEEVGATNVTQTLRDIGANNIQVLRGVEDGKAYRAGLNNVTTAYDLMLLFERIARKEIVNAEACDAMINVLLDQRFNNVIPGKLPEDVKVAHKTGWITGVRHDSGIVFLPDGKTYVLVLLSKEVKDDEGAKEMMAAVSKTIYDYVNR
ncbi:MAG: serine hydrolase [Cyclobacteriaceae bacterium]|nr:serine hydrolase [Cyclobacteriaceae bacterium]